MQIDDIVRKAQQQRASDIHIVSGLPIRVRIDGKLVNLDDRVMTEADCERLAVELAGNDYDKMRACGELDFAGTMDGDIRCRMNLYRQQRTVSAAIRILSDKIPELSKLGLPEAVATFAEYRNGIVLVTGETGSGKSTTLASLLDEINHTREQQIITLEDPIEYVYTPDRCTITQREIGVDTESYENGLRALLREDPDVILIGEMRDLITVETALTAAETGHLVFATLHTNSAPDTIERIVGVFPSEKQQQIRLQLSMCLRAVISQQLLVRKGGKGRTAVCEVMIVNSAIRSLIREGKTPQIHNALATSAAEGNITMDNSLLKMFRLGIIDGETALAAAHDPEAFSKASGIMPSHPASSAQNNGMMSGAAGIGRRPMH